MDFSEWSPRFASPLKIHLSRDTQTKALAVPGDIPRHLSQLFINYIAKQGLPEFLLLPPVFFICFLSDPV